jgi:hypothetical protein
MLVEFRHRSWFEQDVLVEVLRWLDERRIAYVTVDAPRLDAQNVPVGRAYGNRRSRVHAVPRAQRRDVEHLGVEAQPSGSTTSTPRRSCASGSSPYASLPPSPRRPTHCSTTTTTRRTA